MKKNFISTSEFYLTCSIVLLLIFFAILLQFDISFNKEHKPKKIEYNPALGVLYLKPSEVHLIPSIRETYDGVIYVPETKSIYYLTKNLERDKKEIDLLLKEIGW